MNYGYIAVSALLGAMFGFNSRLKGRYSRTLDGVLALLIFVVAAVAWWRTSWQTAAISLVVALICGAVLGGPTRR